MDDPIIIERADVSMSTDLGPAREVPQAGTPFRILILGDFSGRANRGVETDGSDMDQRTLFQVDRDSDESVMQKMGVSVRLDVAGEGSPPVELGFTAMDHFHPDQIYFNAPLFAALKKTRRRLMDSDTAAEMIAALSGSPSPRPAETGSGPAQESMKRDYDFSSETTTGLLDQILDASSPAPADTGPGNTQTDWDRFLGDIVGPHLVPDIEKEQDAMLAAVDRSISNIMRGILHHPDFQAVEAAWRGLQWTLRRLETDETLIVYLLDVSKSELASDLTAHDDLTKTALYKTLNSTSGQSNAQAPWSLLAGNYTFYPEKKDAIVLAQIGAVGQMVDAPFIACGAAGFVGSPSLAAAPESSDWTLEPDPAGKKAWDLVRTLPEANWLGLALPRFLVRMPYGDKTDPVDAFELEEMADPVAHEHYLWANPIFALIMILGRTFSRNGWDWSAGIAAEVNDLPMHLVDEEGQQTIKSCTEVYLGDRAVETIADNGLMPLVAFREQGCARLVRLQSITDPPRPLAGPWR